MADREIFEKVSDTEIKITKTETKENTIDIGQLKERLQNVTERILNVQNQRDIELSTLDLEKQEIERLISEAGKVGVQIKKGAM